MDELTQDVARAAASAVTTFGRMGSAPLDYSVASLAVVEEILAEVVAIATDPNPDRIEMLVEDFGCYILEVGRKEFGGRFTWFGQREQPVLVVGEPAFRIAMITWDKVRGRLGGDKADNVPFFYAGFAARVRQAKPGDDALYV